MDSHLGGLLELLLVFGAVIAVAIRELLVLRRARREREAARTVDDE